ncbi:MAG: glucose-6-phosphate isomerase [Leptospiraceae bacterium]|nr:glucose-6-phosphate isomerase [Leptospiraceae bacterium]
MSLVKIDTRFTKGFFSESELQTELQAASKARETLRTKSGKGNDFLGWLDLPSKTDAELLNKIKNTTERLTKISEFLVVVGIGGSYLGAKAVIEAGISPFQGFKENEKNSAKILYAGHHIDSDYHSELLSFLNTKEFSIIVISKSGTTTEPALAFRSLLTLLEKKYGKDKTKDRVVSVTDANKGALKKLSTEYGFETYVIADDVGGRFSVFTPVGLLPIACAGLDIVSLIAGAKEMETNVSEESDPKKNLSCYYASVRNLLYKKGKKTEILVNYNPRLIFVTEWWKQLFGESEGKEKKGIFPAGVNFTTDLHSLGQYIQDGERNLFETILKVTRPKTESIIQEFSGDPDGLNYLAGKSVSHVNSKAIEATCLAHYEGGVPQIEIEIPELNMKTLGAILFMFEYACGISGYMLDVNPFDQPGVEDYKNNMFALLGKKGYEKKKEEVEAKLNSL